MTNPPRNFFAEALERAKERGKQPDKWVINGHIASALVMNLDKNAHGLFDHVSLDDQPLEILGLPVKKSFKIEPMTVLLAQGSRGFSSFTIPLVLDLTELGPIG